MVIMINSSLRSVRTCSFAQHGTARSTHRHFSQSAALADASRPAPPASPTAAPGSPGKAATGENARSRLARLQAQRLEELNRGRGGTGGAGGTARPNKPEQKWSNRTLIALATSVGACTYLVGTYHGYNAGKQHAFDAIQTEASGVGPVEASVLPAPTVPRTDELSRSRQAQFSLFGALPEILAQVLPLGWLKRDAIHCESQSQQLATTKSNCRLAELTQYHCDLHTHRVVCQPIDRIFRMWVKSSRIGACMM